MKSSCSCSIVVVTVMIIFVVLRRGSIGTNSLVLLHFRNRKFIGSSSLNDVEIMGKCGLQSTELSNYQDFCIRI